jgi:hypothetical protein
MHQLQLLKTRKLKPYIRGNILWLTLVQIVNSVNGILLDFINVKLLATFVIPNAGILWSILRVTTVICMLKRLEYSPRFGLTSNGVSKVYKTKPKEVEFSDLSPEEKMKTLRKLAIDAENAKAFRIKHPTDRAAIKEQVANSAHTKARLSCLTLVSSNPIKE